jgi:hypothetical protein
VARAERAPLLALTLLLALGVAAPAQAAELAPTAPRPAAYADKVLVILNASLDRGVAPAGLPTAARTPGVTLERLDSSSFKNLMPCYEIIVAGAFSDKKQALALHARLKAAGVDVAVKPAGAYLGPRPELAGACAAMRAPPARSEQVLLRAAPGFRLPLDPAVEAQALAGAPKVKAMRAELDAWSAPLPHRTLGRWTVGQRLPGIDHDAGPVGCTVTGFSVGVVGTPHFGWVQEGDHSAPSCGTPAVYATVDCDADLVDLRPGSRAAVSRGAPRPPKEPLAQRPPPWPALAEALARGATHAQQQGAALKQEWTVTPVELAGERLRLVSVKLWTNEGFAVCGGEDLLEVWTGVLGPDDRARGPAVQTTFAAVLGLVQAGPGAPLELHLRDELTGSERLVGGPDELRLDQPFCDCGC